MLVSTLVANDLSFTGQKIRRKGMTEQSFGDDARPIPQIATQMRFNDGHATHSKYPQQFTE
jgi:hypothetical protein